jgi:ubiquinone/menaquinone biosynthesis C-methylase UbiE
MSFSSFFSKQARKPSGLFGRLVMSNIFDFGNNYLNQFVNDLLSPQNGESILDIGCGTGKLIYTMASQTSDGKFEGIDFSEAMISIAQKRNRESIQNGQVKILKGNFDELPLQNEYYDKVCSINTIYFWSKPEYTAQKIASITTPGGFFVAGFEDMQQLEQRNLDSDVFKIYSTEEAKNLFVEAGFSSGVTIESRTKGKLVYNCVVARK